MPRRQNRAKSFSYDLQADWRPFAQAAVDNRLGWIYHGTVTLDGVTGALAWRHGWFGIAVGAYPVIDLGLWERIAIEGDLSGRAVPGWETVPVFPEVHPEATSPNAWAKGPRCDWPDKGGTQSPGHRPAPDRTSPLLTIAG